MKRVGAFDYFRYGRRKQGRLIGKHFFSGVLRTGCQEQRRKHWLFK